MSDTNATKPDGNVFQFLCGEAPMLGVWFGDAPPGYSAFWWRKHLRAEVARLESECARLREQRDGLAAELSAVKLDRDSIKSARDYAEKMESSLFGGVVEETMRADDLKAERDEARALLKDRMTVLLSEETMQRWDRWRAAIASGQIGSGPRDDFEAWLDWICEPIRAHLGP